MAVVWTHSTLPPTMAKDFDGWNTKKQNIDTSESTRFYREREVWWCHLGLNIGSEQDGSGKKFARPVLILKGLSKTTCFIVPLTTSAESHAFRVPLGVVDGRPAQAIISQMRVVDTRRFINRMDTISQNLFEKVQTSAAKLIAADVFSPLAQQGAGPKPQCRSHD